MQTITSKLLAQLNAKRGLKYPDIGFLFFADIKGNGTSCNAIWQIINANGGVTRSELNARSKRQQCDKIRAALG